MTVTVRINGLTLSHKASGGWVRSTLPDVCKSPEVPVPYTNVAFSKTLEKGTTTVLADGHHMISVRGSEYHTSIGDEPGTGGGVISGVNMDRATWLSWSPNVFMEGRPVCRHSDKMLLNRGNTVSIGGDNEIPLDDHEEVICTIACFCYNLLKGKLGKGETYQECVNQTIRQHNYQNGYPRRDVNPGLWSEVPFWRAPGWPMINAQPPNQDLPTSNYIRPNSRRVDLAYVVNGQIQTVYDLKFPGDPPLATSDPDRLRDYEAIAAAHGYKFDEFNVEERCGCADEKWKKLLAALMLLLLLLLLRGRLPRLGPMPMPGPAPVPAMA